MLHAMCALCMLHVLFMCHAPRYSWLLSSFATAMYVGGFIMMTPQLFINYKLKSVTHLPWRVFVYKVWTYCVVDVDVGCCAPVCVCACAG